MKRLIVLLVAACIGVCANAQVRALGATFGTYEAVSMQHWVYGTDNVFQLDLGYHTGLPAYKGLPAAGAVKLMASYNIMVYSPEWTNEGYWNIYAGPGIYLGGGWKPGKGLTFGIMAIAGLEYRFEYHPILLSADIRPSAGMVLTNNKFIYDRDTFLDLVPTVSVRYLF